jgi:hypothetical protein
MTRMRCGELTTSESLGWTQYHVDSAGNNTWQSNESNAVTARIA